MRKCIDCASEQCPIGEDSTPFTGPVCDIMLDERDTRNVVVGKVPDALTFPHGGATPEGVTAVGFRLPEDGTVCEWEGECD